MGNTSYVSELYTYAVLRMSGWQLYSLAKTKGTIPCGRAACKLSTVCEQSRRFFQRKTTCFIKEIIMKHATKLRGS